MAVSRPSGWAPSRIGRALHHAFFSRGFSLFGPRFARDYLRFAWQAARQWGDTNPGVLQMLGCRIEYFNRSDALFLVHEIFVDGIYAFASSTSRPRIVDCGSNIGLSIVFFKAMYPHAEIVAFEPDPVTFARLKDTVERNRFENVRLVNAAVAEEAGTVLFHRASGKAGDMLASIDPAWGGASSERVQAVRLSSCIERPIDFLKLDVEGAEYGVVRDLDRAGSLGNIREAVIEVHKLNADSRDIDAMAATLEASGLRVSWLRRDPGAPDAVIRASRKTLAPV